MRVFDRMSTAVLCAGLGALALSCAARPASPRRANDDPRDGATFGSPVWLSNHDQRGEAPPTLLLDGASYDGGGVSDAADASTLDDAMALSLDAGDAGDAGDARGSGLPSRARSWSTLGRRP